MKAPVESFMYARGEAFRVLVWGEGDETVLFLHGLSGVAEVWGPTVEHLAAGRRYVAMDMRGHGQSFAPETGYTAADMAGDVRSVVQQLGGNVHLVGHSMGARIALVLAATSAQLFQTAAIVDIGPEASSQNIADTVKGVSSRPERFANRKDALAFAFRNRKPTKQDEAIFLARLKPEDDGSLTWRASVEALTEAVTRQRGRAYWAEWRRIEMPALFVHGGSSNEVSTAIADRMRNENLAVGFERLEGIGHNIPLIAPEKLAALLEDHWSTHSARPA